MKKPFALYMAVVVCLVAGCNTTAFKNRADKETYAVIAEKSGDVPNMETPFTIDRDTQDLLAGLPTNDKAEDFLGDVGTREQGASVISLEKALELSVKNSRSYQDKKEALYLEALSLTLARHRYAPIFSASGSSRLNRTTRDVQVDTALSSTARLTPEAIRRVGQLTGTPAELYTRYAQLVESAAAVAGIDQPAIDVQEERSVSGSSQLGVSLLLKGGAEIAAGVTSNFLRFLTNDPRVSATSALTASIQQPLLRGAGRKVAEENLTQAERDLLYQLRDFTQFRKDFAVLVASQYYQVLQNRDAANNTWLGFQAFKVTLERERALTQEGRQTLSDLGRLEQAYLSSEGSWVGAVRTYAQRMDAFKIFLGLPTDAHVVLNPTELKQLMERGLLHPSISAEDAVQVALATRLDLYTVRDKKDDAGRKVVVAKNALLPDLNLVASANVGSRDNNRFQEFDFERARLEAGFDTDLGLDRKAERNTYRASLIAFDQATRAVDLTEDNVKLDIRDEWRQLDQAKRNYEIQQKAVELNERRVEEQTLLAELGRAKAQDQVDAQNDLVSVRNDLTAALVAHTIARLQFWRDMGILFIKENGQWEEVTDVKQPEPK